MTALIDDTETKRRHVERPGSCRTSNLLRKSKSKFGVRDSILSSSKKLHLKTRKKTKRKKRQTRTDVRKCVERGDDGKDDQLPFRRSKLEVEARRLKLEIGLHESKKNPITKSQFAPSPPFTHLLRLPPLSLPPSSSGTCEDVRQGRMKGEEGETGPRSSTSNFEL